MIKIVAPIKPVPFKRPDSNGKRRYDKGYYREFKELLGWIAKKAMGERKPLTGAISAQITIHKKRRGILKSQWGDIDNFVKAVFDALNGICFEDDAQVKRLTAEKFYGSPKVSICLEEI